MSGKDLKGGVNGIFEMGLHEGIDYVLFKNPVSATVLDTVKYLGNSAVFRNSSTSAPVVKIPPELQNLPVSRLVLCGNPFIRLAGVSGACAVVLGAYGSHSLNAKEGYEEQKRIYQTANTYHFMHTLALFGVPLCRHPVLAGSLITTGMLLFCGTCYYDVFTGKSQFRKLTPIGGVCLIAGWLCFLL